MELRTTSRVTLQSETDRAVYSCDIYSAVSDFPLLFTMGQDIVLFDFELFMHLCTNYGQQTSLSLL